MPAKTRELTGRKVLLIALGGFGVVVAVNITMATLAVGGFPGLVVKNPYVAGQHFQAETAAEKALDWQVGADWAGGVLSVAITDAAGAPPAGLEVSALVGRPATESADRELALRRDGAAWTAPARLDPGLWRVEITARRDGEVVYTIADQVWSPEPGADG